MLPLDLPQQDQPKRRYHRRSAILYVVSWSIISGLILFGMYKPDAWRAQPTKGTVDLFVGLIFFIVTLFSPLGVYWSIKGFRQKEGNSVSRVLHIIGHLLLGLVLISIIGLIGVKVSETN